MRSQLRLDTRGLTVCREHGDGSDVAELSMLNAEAAEAWAQELASRQPRDRGGEYGPERIARDPAIIFAGAEVLFDADATRATVAAGGYVTALSDAAGSGETLVPYGGYEGFHYAIDKNLGAEGLPSLGLVGSSGEGMLASGVVASLPVTYWGLIRVSNWATGDAFLRSNVGVTHGCTLATGDTMGRYKIRNGVAIATEAAGPGPGDWFRFTAIFVAGASQLRVGPNAFTADVGALTLDGLELMASPGIGVGVQWWFHRLLVLNGVPTETMLDEADEWVLSRVGGRPAFL